MVERLGNRLITAALLGLVISIFALYFIALRSSFPSGQPVEGLFRGIIRDARRDDWPAARDKAERLRRIWTAKKRLIYMNFADEVDLVLFERALNRVAAAAETATKIEAVGYAETGRTLWRNFLRILPEP